MENNNINLSKEIINQIEINSSVEKNDNLNLQQKVEQQENEQKKKENLNNQITLKKYYETILENVEKKRNLILKQNNKKEYKKDEIKQLVLDTLPLNKSNDKFLEEIQYLNEELTNLKRSHFTLKIHEYNSIKKKIEKLEKQNEIFKEYECINILQKQIEGIFATNSMLLSHQENINEKCAMVGFINDSLVLAAKDSLKQVKKFINENNSEIIKLCNELKKYIEYLE